MINRTLMLEYLETYNEDEIFYREYYDALKVKDKDPAALQAFLAKHSREEVMQRHLICPELSDFDPNVIYENVYFEKDSEKNVWVQKHNRYSPLFWHRHQYFEVFYVLDGTCTHYINGTETILPKGTLCLIAPGAVHAIGVFDDSIVLNIFIRKSTFADIFFNLLRSRNVISDFFICNLYHVPGMDYLFFNAEDDDLEDLLLTMLEEELEEDVYTYRILDYYIGIFFTKLVHKYGMTAESEKSSGKMNSVIVDILSYLNDHYQSVSLTEIAEHFGYAPEHISRLLKAETGKNFTALLRDIRMKRAEAMLDSTPLAIEEISSSVGYESPGAFIKYFRMTHGVTPTAYRRRPRE